MADFVLGPEEAKLIRDECRDGKPLHDLEAGRPEVDRMADFVLGPEEAKLIRDECRDGKPRHDLEAGRPEEEEVGENAPGMLDHISPETSQESSNVSLGDIDVDEQRVVLERIE